MNVISYTTSQLRHIDEVPYKSLARKRVPLVMVSTAEYPAFAHGPALFSHRIVTRELRRHIKFHGVSISDDLETPVAERYGSPSDRAVKSARAGVDRNQRLVPDVAVVLGDRHPRDVDAGTIGVR